MTKHTAAHARLRGRAHALASAYSLYAYRNWLARRPLKNPIMAMNSRAMIGRGDLVSVPELAALAHLPVDPAAVGLARAGARAVPPPPGIPSPDPAAGIKPLGIADAGSERPVGIKAADARQHLHLLGATGSGKSTLMMRMALDDVEAGRGAVLIDPKGDMIKDLLGCLPEKALGKVVLFDPDDASAPPRLNVLQAATPEERDMVTDNLVGIFKRIFAAYWGPRTDDIFRAACLTLLHTDPGGEGTVTLADVPKLLEDPTFRRRNTAGLRDEILSGFWAWYEDLSPASRSAAIGPLMNKLRAFLLRQFVRDSIASPGPSSFDMGKVLDGGLCMVRVPKGAMGEENARLLGSFLVAKTWQAASNRARLAYHERIDATLYIDECHNFLTLPYSMQDMLAEARGYGLSLVLAHQNLAQLPKDLREGVSANARTKIYFNASPEDAVDLERHTAPILTSHDLAHLGLFQAAARVVVDLEERPAFTLRTQPVPEQIPGRAEAVRRSARMAYGAPPGERFTPPKNTTGEQPKPAPPAQRPDPRALPTGE